MNPKHFMGCVTALIVLIKTLKLVCCNAGEQIGFSIKGSIKLGVRTSGCGPAGLSTPNDPGSNPCNRQLLILFMNSNKLKDENMNIKKLGIPIKTRFDPFRRQQTPTHQAFVYFRGNDGFEFRQLKISRQF